MTYINPPEKSSVKMTIRLRPTHRELKSLLLYLIDWIFVGGTALVAFAFGKLTPNLRPFSIEDPSISFPFQDHAKIPTWLLGIISTIIPGVLIALTVFVHPKTRAAKLKTRFWLLNTAWLGLAVALAAAMLITDGMKNLVGKPRPDLIFRCAPDPERLASGRFSVGNRYLFNAGVCTSWDGISEAGLGRDELLDGFRSWVSGHTSLSFAGLTYLTIFWSFHLWKLRRAGSFQGTSETGLPKQGSHPSAPLLLVLSVPMLSAIYVGTTRFSDYRHGGVDIIFGGLVGVGTAILGWAVYGSRSVDCARGFGGSLRKKGHDLEQGHSQGKATEEEPVLPGAQVLSRSSAQVVGGDNAVGTQGQLGNAVEGQSNGALQLREMSLSISTIDGPEDANRRRSAEVIPSADSTEALHPESSEPGSSRPQTDRELYKEIA